MMSDMLAPPQPRPPTYIERIRIENLFGYLTYTIPDRNLNGADFSRLLILYGDNGSGKTTILTLLFCLLSAQSGRGEKTYIARIPFKRFEIFFDDGTSVSAEKSDEQLVGSYTVGIRRAGARERTFFLKVNDEIAVKAEDPLPDLLKMLADIGVSLYFLPDDRRVRTTFGAEPASDDSSLAVRIRSAAIRTGESVRFLRATERQESHHLDISPVLAEISSWLRRHALQGSSTGEENATSIYLRVIEQIARLPRSQPAPVNDEALIGRLERLAGRMDAFTRFGLIAPFPAEKFLSAFVGAGHAAKLTIATVLEPYVDGLEARLKALEEIRNVIATYVETTNSFLTAKSVEFSLQAGAVIRGYRTKPLDPNWLSSGEKQLILLLSNTVLARESASIFLIDEPELSLNVKWQRRLADALLRCAQGSSIQYLLASHSLELITQHKPNAVRLTPEGVPLEHA